MLIFFPLYEAKTDYSSRHDVKSYALLRLLALASFILSIIIPIKSLGLIPRSAFVNVLTCKSDIHMFNPF